MGPHIREVRSEHGGEIALTTALCSGNVIQTFQEAAVHLPADIATCWGNVENALHDAPLAGISCRECVFPPLTADGADIPHQNRRSCPPRRRWPVSH